MQLNFICFAFVVYDATMADVALKTRYLVRSLANICHKIGYFLFEPDQQHSS